MQVRVFSQGKPCGFCGGPCCTEQVFLPVVQFKLGSHYSTETPLSLSPRAGTVAPSMAAVPRDFVLH